MYVQNIYTILHDFRRPVESATIEIWNSTRRDKPTRRPPPHPLRRTDHKRGTAHQWVLGRARSGQIGEGWEDRSWEEMEMWEGIGPQVSKALPPPPAYS